MKAIQHIFINNSILTFSALVSKVASFFVLALLPVYLGSEAFSFEPYEISKYIVKVLILTTFIKVIGGVIGDFLTSSKWLLVGSLALFALAFLCFTSKNEGTIDFGLFLYVVATGFFDPNLNAHFARINFQNPRNTERLFFISSYLMVVAVVIASYVFFQVQNANPESTVDFTSESINSNYNLPSTNGEAFIELIHFVFYVVFALLIVSSILLCFVRNERFDEKTESVVKHQKMRALSLMGLILAPIAFVLLYSIIISIGGFGVRFDPKIDTFFDLILKSEALVVGLPIVVLFYFVKLHSSFKLVIASILCLISLVIAFRFSHTSNEILIVGYLTFGIAETLFLPSIFTLIYRNTRPKYFASIYGASAFVGSFISIILLVKAEMQRETIMILIGFLLILTIALALVGKLLQKEDSENGKLRDTKNLDEF